MKIFNKLFRTSKYLYLRFLRLGGSPEEISRGVAVGLFVGLIAPIGLQTIIVLPLAFLLKAKKLPAIVFTWLTNPYTIIFIYPVQCYLGSLFYGQTLSFHKVQNIFKNFFEHFFEKPDIIWSFTDSLRDIYIISYIVPTLEQAQASISALLNLGTDILIPFIIGGGFIGLICAITGYFASYGLIVSHRAKKQKKLRMKFANKVANGHYTSDFKDHKN